VRALPGVVNASLAVGVPPRSGVQLADRVEAEGASAPSSREMTLIPFVQAEPSLFSTLGIRVTHGRALTEEDRRATDRRAVIDPDLARALWPNAVAVGRRFRLGPDEPWITVVGVVADVKEALDTVPGLQGYWPHAQMAWARDMALVVRTSGDPLALIPAIRSVVRTTDHEIPLVKAVPMTELMSESVSGPRFRTVVVLSFAGAACLLALIGIYGVMAFVVAERKHEIGVRMALGARQSGVMRHVLGQGLRLTALGIAIGLVGAFIATRAIQAMLFGVTPTDPLTYAAVIVALVIVAMLACWVPALRASRVDPLVALRSD
jgi:putative ABC transport system permease protein